ncbi:MAG: carbamoyltransferase [Phycisphaerales bacterium]|nr:carbamoyltransferase [Phycisphaerales bacterium]
MNILGFSGITAGKFYHDVYGLRFVGHDASVALVQGGRVTFAAEEERFSRIKHTSGLPTQALDAALHTTGLSIKDIDAVSYTWNADISARIRMYLHHPLRIPFWHWPALGLAGYRVLRDLMSPRRIGRAFEKALDTRLPPVRGIRHHLTHAACAYFPSPFYEAAVLTVDGQGEHESATLGEWRGTRYRRFQSVYSPDSIGILYGMVTDFLGMRAAWDEYKVMAMASLGDPARFATQFDTLVQIRPNGRYRTFRTALVFCPGYCDRLLERTLGVPKRTAAPLEQVHFDIAAALQRKLEEVLFHLLHRLRRLSSSRNLCMAGGVFLNSVANGKIRRSGLFDNVFIPPVPGDHGGALGAALATYYALTGGERSSAEFSPFSGPGYSEREIETALMERGAALRFHRPAQVAESAAELLAAQRIIGWFQGRMEYGPRALGHRSILASPARAEMRDLVNERIKHRELFRPFAGAVPFEVAEQYFELDGRESPYMQFVLPVRESSQAQIPAVVHRGTCRVQTVSRESDPLFHGLLHAFGRRTGVPVLLNTSFNDRDEPIVCSPQDAIRTFLNTDLDALVLGPFLVFRTNSA